MNFTHIGPNRGEFLKHALLIFAVLAILFSFAGGIANACEGEDTGLLPPDSPILTGSCESKPEAEIPFAPFSAIQVSDWAELRSAVNNAPSGTSITIEITADFNSNSGISPNPNAITIPAGRTITITSNTDGPFTLTQTTANQRHFVVNGRLTLRNVTLDGGAPPTGVNRGGVLVDNGGRLYLEDGGRIINNRVFGSGGGVQISNSATFRMNGGEISGNAASSQGGGVAAQFNGNSFTMNGGTINNNTASSGAGVFVNGALSTFNMSGGTISHNVPTFDGGGVQISNSATFRMSGGTISHNGRDASGAIVARQGGGVSLSSGRFYMSGTAVIKNNAASFGGGVYQWAGQGNHAFIMTGGTISGNTATSQGGGVFTLNWPGWYNFTITSGTISDNTAAHGGGGIFFRYYTDATIRPNVIFSGNTANRPHDFSRYSGFTPGGMVPATGSNNIGGSTANITTPNTVSISGTHILNNFDVNFGGQPIQFLRFDPNGGAFTGTDQLPMRIVASYTPHAQAFDIDGNLLNQSLSHPTRTGYTFNGWFNTQANASGTTQVGQVLPSHLVLSEVDRTLWAQWRANQYTITYRAGINGTGAQVVDDVTFNQTLNLRTENPVIFTRSGYTLTGWNTAADGGGTSFPLGASHTVSGNLILYAQWQVNQYTITYRAGTNGTGAQVVDNVVFNQTLNLRTESPVIFTRNGYTLTGWNTAASGGGTAFSLGASHTVSGNLILYAQWTANSTGGNGGNDGGTGTGNITVGGAQIQEEPYVRYEVELPIIPEYIREPIAVTLLFMIGVAAFAYRRIEDAK